MPESAVEIPGSAGEAAAAVARAAELWGAELEPGGEGRFHLRFAVAAGLRRGWMTGEVRIEPAGPERARVVFSPESAEYRLQVAAVGILVLGALGAVATVLFPFFPGLLPLAPIGIVLGLAAWFLVLSRLHTSGPEELLASVVEIAAEPGRPKGGESAASDAGLYS
jgi:hypothetical protein